MMKNPLQQVHDLDASTAAACPGSATLCNPNALTRRDVVRIGSWVIFMGALGGTSLLAESCGPATPNSEGVGSSPTPTGSSTPGGSPTPTPNGSPTPTGTPNNACGCGTTPTGADWHTLGLNSSQLPLNAVAYNATNQIFVCHDSQGFYAIDSICPHQGCDIGVANSGHYSPSNLSGGFTCTCHTSKFDGNGKVLSGPASPNSLNHYALTTDASGTFFVNYGHAGAYTSCANDCRC